MESVRVVGFCGIVCSDCPVFKATLKDDDAERRSVAELFTKQYGREYKPEDINCDGCISDSERVFSFCQICEIRECGKKNGVKDCAYCIEYPCGRLSQVFSEYSKAKETLDLERAKIFGGHQK
jgi:hypothetical protein